LPDIQEIGWKPLNDSIKNNITSEKRKVCKIYVINVMFCMHTTVILKRHYTSYIGGIFIV